MRLNMEISKTAENFINLQTNNIATKINNTNAFAYIFAMLSFTQNDYVI